MQGKYYKFLATLFILWLFLVAFIWIYQTGEKEETIKWRAFNFDRVIFKMNEKTGETWYWMAGEPGWVKIKETNLVTAMSKAEREKQNEIFNRVYIIYEGKKSQEQFMGVMKMIFEDTPSYQLDEIFETYFEENKFSDGDLDSLMLRYAPKLWMLIH